MRHACPPRPSTHKYPPSGRSPGATTWVHPSLTYVSPIRASAPASVFSGPYDAIHSIPSAGKGNKKKISSSNSAKPFFPPPPPAALLRVWARWTAICAENWVIGRRLRCAVRWAESLTRRLLRPHSTLLLPSFSICQPRPFLNCFLHRLFFFPQGRLSFTSVACPARLQPAMATQGDFTTAMTNRSLRTIRTVGPPPLLCLNCL